MDGDNKIIAARLEQIRRENGLTLDAMGEITRKIKKPPKLQVA